MIVDNCVPPRAHTQALFRQIEGPANRFGELGIRIRHEENLVLSIARLSPCTHYKRIICCNDRQSVDALAFEVLVEL